MSNFFFVIDDLLKDQNKGFKDLENAGILSQRSFYHMKDFTPYLNTIIKIANYLEVSLDYIFDRNNVNKFSKYKEPQQNIYGNIIKTLKEHKVTQSEITDKLHIGRSNFTYWKQGSIPKISTLISIADYLNCSLDEFVDLE